MHPDALGFIGILAGNGQPVPQGVVVVTIHISDRLERFFGPGRFGIIDFAVIYLRMHSGCDNTEFNTFFLIGSATDESPFFVFEDRTFQRIAKIVAERRYAVEPVRIGLQGAQGIG